MKKEIFIAALLGSAAIFVQAQSDEQSFMAPLVKESLLLGAATAKSSVIVGERGHVLVNNSPEDLTIANFTQVVVPTKATLTNVYSIDELVWAVGHDATIIKSLDAGATWTLVQNDPDLDRPLLSVHFFNKSEGIAVGAYGLFYRTLDGGDTWAIERHPSMLSADDNDYLNSIKEDEAFYLEELSFISPHLNQISSSQSSVYVAGEAGLIAVSKDKGMTWERLDIDYQGSFFDVANVAPDQVLAVGLRGNMFVIEGNDYRLIPTCVTTSLNAVIRDNDMVYVLGNNGIVLRIDPSKLDSRDLQAANSEACQQHIAISSIETEFSDAILTGMAANNRLIVVTGGGLQTVAIEE